MIVAARRASAILFNLISSLRRPGRFLLPANVCPIVPLTFLKARREFEFVDITAETLCMDLGAARRILEQRPDDIAGVVFVRTYGAIYPVDPALESLRTTAADVMIIDDRCLCRPELHETLRGPADAILYSTGRAKFADLGFGGYAMLKPCTSYSPRSLAFSGQALTKLTRGYTRAIETNRRFEYRDCDWLEMTDDTDVSGAYWERISEASERADIQKKELNSLYSTLLPTNCQLPPEFQTWRFNIMVKDKTRLIREVFRAGLFASSHFVPLTGIFADGNAPEADRLHGSIVNLFNDHFFDPPRAKKLAIVVTRHLEHVLHQQ